MKFPKIITPSCGPSMLRWPRIHDEDCLIGTVAIFENVKEGLSASGFGFALGSAALARRTCPVVSIFPVITWSGTGGGSVTYGAWHEATETLWMPNLGNDQYIELVSTATSSYITSLHTPEGFGNRFPMIQFGSDQIAVIDQTGRVYFYNPVTYAINGNVITPNVAAGPFFCLACDPVRSQAYSPSLGGGGPTGPTVVNAIDAVGYTNTQHSFPVHGGRVTFLDNVDRLLITNEEASGISYYLFNPGNNLLTNGALSIGTQGRPFYVRELGILAMVAGGLINIINPLTETVIANSVPASQLYAAVYDVCSNTLLCAVGPVIEVLDVGNNYALSNTIPVLGNTVVFDKWTGLIYAIIGGSLQIDTY